MSDPIRVRRFDGVTHLELHRPWRRNTIDLGLAREMLRVALDPATRSSSALLLTGAGEHFCAGGDLKSFQVQRALPEHLLAVTADLHTAMLRLRELDAPLVVAARGNVAGAGLGLACFGDVLLTTPESTFRSGYTALGLTPDAGTSHAVTRLIGPRRAERLLLLGEVVSGRLALDWGLCTALVTDADLDRHAVEVARTLAANPPFAVGETRRLIGAAATRSLAEHLDDEARTLARAAGRPAAAAQVAAFGARRRQPQATGP
ncbi:enoyl-CoA hydratase/isomerase family protein [Salinispora pacifica]|uniref:enoyl-CoA hydratase/isomerase family protein n=1 Tax=Salinispora pacifica TaxID=351187 RepID=UPI0003721B1B|nr:enoyl-CoA hydratase/isomerase family protein [Salinispora pacifica]